MSDIIFWMIFAQTGITFAAAGLLGATFYAWLKNQPESAAENVRPGR